MLIPEDSLAARSLSAIKWNYLGVVVRIASQLAVQIVLARLLGPEAFGVFAVVFLFIGVGNVIVEMGLGSALIQKKRLTNEEIRFAFTRILVTGLTVGSAVFFCADVVANVFDNVRIAEIARGIAPVFVFQAFCVVPSALLKRDLAFKKLQVVQVLTYLLGFLVVGVSFAYLGYGVWSLAAAWLSQTFFSALAFNLIRSHPKKFLFILPDKELQNFGLKMMFSNVANWLIENIDNLLIGKLFGTRALGIYSVSYNLVRTPANHLVVTLQAVLFPASARAQENDDHLRRAYLTAVAGVALVVIPVFSGIAAVSSTIVHTLYGQSWSDAAPVLIPLSLAMVPHALMAIAGPILWGKGASDELKIQTLVALALTATILITSRYSVLTTAWAVLGIYTLRFALLSMALLRRINLQFSQLLLAISGGIIAGVIVVSLLLVLDFQLASMIDSLRLSIEILMAALALLIFILVSPEKALSSELISLLQRLLINSPRLASISILRRFFVKLCGNAGRAP